MFWNVSFICVGEVYHSELDSVFVVIFEVIGDSWRIGEGQSWLWGCMEWLGVKVGCGRWCPCIAGFISVGGRRRGGVAGVLGGVGEDVGAILMVLGCGGRSRRGVGVVAGVVGCFVVVGGWVFSFCIGVIGDGCRVGDRDGLAAQGGASHSVRIASFRAIVAGEGSKVGVGGDSLFVEGGCRVGDGAGLVAQGGPSHSVKISSFRAVVVGDGSWVGVRVVSLVGRVSFLLRGLAAVSL